MSRMLIVMSLLCLSTVAVAQGADPVVLETDTFRMEAGADGLCRAFVDRATGTDHLAAEPPTPFLSAKVDGAVIPASALALKDGLLSATFGDSGKGAVLKVERFPAWLTLEVVSADEGIGELAFLDVPLTLSGTLEDAFAACALSLNLQTKVPALPGPAKRLQAFCYPRFGMAGAKAALIACPAAQLRDTLKTVVSGAEGLPQPAPGTTPIGGPWALDAPINRGSYLFDFGALTEETVDEWIELLHTLGLNQIDFHTGTSLRFGDCAPDPKLFPRGRDSVKAVIDRLHGAGIAAGLHTYAFFIAKDTPYVTPVPDPRLGTMAVFTLAAPLAEGDTTVTVAESTADVSTITGFFVRNSVTLRIGEELITFSGATKEAPFSFTGCTRGAHGTKVSAHPADAQAHQLKECFGLFTPDADSTLLAEIAKNTADTFNECGFDMIYLDALDGEDILGGGENGWHYGAKFVFEIANRLNKPALFEMSTFHHLLWCVRARMGAWDHPARSHKGFIDTHARANSDGAGMFLPMNLGWWAVKEWKDNPQTEPTYPDDIEYLMGKALGNGMGISLMGVNPKTIKTVPAYRRLAPLFQRYETLRHSGRVPESVKARLREPGAEFVLEGDLESGWQFRPALHSRHKVTGEEGSGAWTVDNPHAAQPARLRIQTLHSAGAYDAPETVVIEDFADPALFADTAAEAGVTMALDKQLDGADMERAAVRVAASSTRDEANGAWAKLARVHTPPLDIKGQQALGVWVHGDGSGALLNLQLRSPHHTVYGGYGEHYVRLDYTGWRYFEMVEPEGGAIKDHQWPYNGGYYAIYREEVDFSQVETLSLWCNRVPKGREAAPVLSAVKALPLVKQPLKNPSVTVDGVTVTFPVTLETGAYLEYNGPGDCKHYAPNGELVGEVVPQGGELLLATGANSLAFSSEAGERPARALLTVTSLGEPFRE